MFCLFVCFYIITYIYIYIFVFFLAIWPDSSATYHRYIKKNYSDNITTTRPFPITSSSSTSYKVEIVGPPLQIIPNDLLPKPPKRLTLKGFGETKETLYKIGTNYIKKISHKNINEYFINNKYRLETTDHLTNDELISLLLY